MMHYHVQYLLDWHSLTQLLRDEPGLKKMASLGTTDAAFYRPEAFPLAQQCQSTE